MENSEYTQVRILEFSNEYEGYKLKSYAYIKNISEAFTTLEYMRKNNLPITINEEADTDGEEYYIDSLSFIFPAIDSEISPHITIYVTNC